MKVAACFGLYALGLTAMHHTGSYVFGVLAILPGFVGLILAVAQRNRIRLILPEERQ